MNPFITLTLLNGQPTTINITKILCYEPRSFDEKEGEFTYILLPSNCFRQVLESYEYTRELINAYYISKFCVAHNKTS